MAVLSFEIEGDKVLSRNFRVLADEIVELAPEFEEVGDAIIDGAKQNFEDQGTETGKWKSLSPFTLQARNARTGYYKNPPSGTPGILQWTGNLKNSFFSETGDLQALVGNAAPYFAFHQSKKRGSGNLPRRIILDMNQSVKLKVTNIIARGINKRVGNFNKQY